MIMIIGGAYQGKFAFAKEKYPEISWVDAGTCGLEEIFDGQGIYHFHVYVERLMREGRSVDSFAGRLISENPDAVIITDEIGYGIVPADPFLREYREKTGRICTELASYSKEVYRVICGMGMRIK